MECEILLKEDELAIMIMNEKGSYIILDLNKESYEQFKNFYEESER